MMSIPNVNLDFAIKGNFTDTEISKFNSSQLAREKDLVPWDGCAEELDDSLGNDLMLNDNDDGGWDANDMFKLNEKKYNLSTTYSESMEGYTVPLDKNAKDYEEREAEANRIAQLIENDTSSKDRLAKEDGDEEDKFSAVIRPNTNESNQSSQQPINVNKQTNYNQTNSTSINQSQQQKQQQQQQHSRHDNNLSNSRNNRNKNNQNTSGNLNTSGSNFSANSSLNRSKNQLLNTSGGNLQQSQPYHFSSNRSNGPMNNTRINTRSDQPQQQQQQYNHDDKDLHHNNRNDRLMHNEQQQMSNVQQSNLSSQQRSHNNNSNNNNRRINMPSQMQKRDETKHDLKSFSSNFKMAINQQQQQQQSSQQISDKDNVNKELAKEMKQLNLNKPTIDSGNKKLIVNKPNQDQMTTTTTINKTVSNRDDDLSQINKPINKPPLIDKLPKDKSPSNDKSINNEQLTTDKVNNKQINKDQNQTKSIESLPQSQQLNESNKQQQDNEQQQQIKAQSENVKLEPQRENETLKQSSPDTVNSQISSSTSDSGKGSSNASSNTELQNADKTLKKSTLNPNAKEFVFNPKANPYTPKFVATTTATYPPAMNPNLPPPPPSAIPNTNINPQLAFQQNPTAHHLAGHPNAPLHGQPNTGSPASIIHPANAVQPQMPISQLNQLGTVQHTGNQQLIAPVLHPAQQPLMAHHPASAQMHQAGAHQMLPFPAHLMSPQSIQFAVTTNPQTSIHHPHQNAHHSHTHHQAPYTIIPAVPNHPVSTANLPPNAQMQTATNQIAVNYAGQTPMQPPNQSNTNQLVNQQSNSNQAGTGQNQSSGNQRGTRNKAGQYHSQSGNANQRSNPNQSQSNTNQPQSIAGNPNQPPNMPNPHLVNQSANPAVYSHAQQTIHLPPNFNHPPNPGAYQIYHTQAFSAHHNPHARLMSPQGISMVHPGMTYATTADPAFQQMYSNYSKLYNNYNNI